MIRGESVDTVTIGGRVTMNDRQYVHLENMTVMGEVRMNGASNMVVRGCRIRTTAGGITFQIGNAVPRNNTIIDNDVVGGATWVDNQLSTDGYNGGEGIQFTGSGHVICFNHVANFRDDISLMEYDEAFEQVSIDICNNDIEQATDDAIEADSAMGNVRVFRNRIRNCFDGISAQPNLGGPTYYVRNAMYNVLYSPFKFHNGTVGDVVVHNTVVKCGDALGIYAGTTWSARCSATTCSSAGWGAAPTAATATAAGGSSTCRTPTPAARSTTTALGSIGTNMFQGRVGAVTFNSFATLTGNTTEAHAVMVDLRHLREPARVPGQPLSAQAGRRPSSGDRRARRSTRVWSSPASTTTSPATRPISAPTSWARRCRPTARARPASSPARAARRQRDRGRWRRRALGGRGRGRFVGGRWPRGSSVAGAGGGAPAPGAPARRAGPGRFERLRLRDRAGHRGARVGPARCRGDRFPYPPASRIARLRLAPARGEAGEPKARRERGPR